MQPSGNFIFLHVQCSLYTVCSYFLYASKSVIFSLYGITYRFLKEKQWCTESESMILVNLRLYLCNKYVVAVLEKVLFEFRTLRLFINIISLYFISVFHALAPLRLARTYKAEFYLPLEWATISCTVRKYGGFAIACLRLYGHFLLYRWLNIS